MSDIYQQLGIIRWVTKQPKSAADNSQLAIIVEPSISHDAQADQLLTAMLKAINLTRDEVNIVGVADIKTAQARFILAMGEATAQSLLNSELPLDSLRGKLHHIGEQQTPAIVTYHPADLLRNPADKKKAYSDLLFVRENL
jgi:DNA polymerase